MAGRSDSRGGGPGRLLNELSAEGLLRVEHDVIVIPDVETLARVASR